MYLLDVNALIALGLEQHIHYRRVRDWAFALRQRAFATCAITELGFLRIVSGPRVYGYSVAAAQAALARVKQAPALEFQFLADGADASALPGWVETSAQVTDGHLWALAREHGAELATLDRSIPGAYVIP